MVWGLPLSLPFSLCSTWSRRSPSSSLFPLSAVPVTTLPAVNRRGDGQRGIKRRRESNWNWLLIGHVIFTPLSLTCSFSAFLSYSTFILPFVNIPFFTLMFSPLYLFLVSFYRLLFASFLSPAPFSPYHYTICLPVSSFCFISFFSSLYCQILTFSLSPYIYFLWPSLSVSVSLARPFPLLLQYELTSIDLHQTHLL